MFACFVFTLFLAVLTDNTYKVSPDDNIVENELANEDQLTNEIVFDTVLKILNDAEHRGIKPNFD